MSDFFATERKKAGVIIKSGPMNTTLDHDDEGGPEIPISQVYCSLIAIGLSIGSGAMLHLNKFDYSAYAKYIVPCEMISMSVEVLLCGYLISTGEAEPVIEAQMLAIIAMSIVFIGQLTRIFVLRHKISNFIKLHLGLNIVSIPFCCYLVVQSLDKPLEMETHMTVIVTGLSARLFMNIFLLLGAYHLGEDEDDIYDVHQVIKEGKEEEEEVSNKHVDHVTVTELESFDSATPSFDGRRKITVTS